MWSAIERVVVSVGVGGGIEYIGPKVRGAMQPHVRLRSAVAGVVSYFGGVALLIRMLVESVLVAGGEDRFAFGHVGEGVELGQVAVPVEGQRGEAVVLAASTRHVVDLVAAFGVGGDGGGAVAGGEGDEEDEEHY